MPSIRWREHALNAAFPLGTAFFLTLFTYLMYVAGDPVDIDELMALLHWFFDTYGDWALFFSAFVEGIYMVNLYFPGSLVIIAAVLFSNQTLPELTVITTLCWLAFMSATVVNYSLGAFGFYRLFSWMGGGKMLRNMHRWLNKHGWWAMLATAFHPNYLAISSVCMGIGREGLLKTLALAGLGMAISGPILTFLTATFSDTIMQDSDTLYFLMIALFYLWGFWLIGKGVWQDVKQGKCS